MLGERAFQIGKRGGLELVAAITFGLSYFNHTNKIGFKDLKKNTSLY